MKSNDWIEQADAAMLRAAARARAVALTTRTTMHIWKDGRIVEISPSQEDPLLKPVEHQERSEGMVLREETAPFRDRKP
ncbi:MAG: hypothetical protein WD342_21105 [Verrucomicrobiales bacterium]